MTSKKGSFIAGLGFTAISENTDITLERAKNDGYDFVTTTLSSLSEKNPRMDITTIEAKWWSTSVVGEIGQVPINETDEGGTKKHNFTTPLSLLCNNMLDALTCSYAERMLYQMVEWACHMNIPAILFPIIPTDSLQSVQYAQAVSSLAAKCSANNVQIWIRVPFRGAYLEAFQLLHRRCDYMSNVGALLVLDHHWENSSNSTRHSTTVAQNLALLHRFVGSNTRAISVHTSIFLTNKQGYPTLQKSLQNIFISLLKRIGRTLRVMLEGDPRHHCSSSIQDIEARGQSGYLSYLQYLRHLRGSDDVAAVLDTNQSTLEENYLDHLQNALQPLGDHLEFQVYENFESDPIKYRKYQSAIELAIRDGMQLDHFHISSNKLMEVTILLVGAGRGPLVEMSLQAISTINKSLLERTNDDHASNNIVHEIHPIIVAIEKNPSAALYLHSLRSREASWKGVVEIVQCDMRYANLHQEQYPVIGRMIHDDRYKADIVISELLGSFGDNELSPECLDGVQSCGLMKHTCVSIPQRYTSFLTPVSSMTLYSHARAQAYAPYDPLEGPAGNPCGMLQAMETPYVVRPHSASQTHREMPCWEFSHPTVRTRNVNENRIDSSRTIVDAIKVVDNKRHVQIIFSPEIMDGMKYGCGYGPVDTVMDTLTTNVAKDSPTATTYSSNIIHGFLGTFHCMLYQSTINDKSHVVISTAPRTFSNGMFSWFPLYFPLREPIQVPAGASICCNMWRKMKVDEEGTGRMVWYEWCADVYHSESSTLSMISSSSVHNPYGRSSHIRL